MTDARSDLRSYGRFALGAASSAAATYLLFLAFAHSGTLVELGIFGIYSAASAGVVNFVVALTEQRIAQEAVRDVSRGGAAAELVRYSLSRVLAVVLAALVVGLVALAVSSTMPLAMAAAAAVLGQGVLGVALGPRVMGSSGRSQLFLQLGGALATLCVAAWVVFSAGRLSGSTMLWLLGGARGAAALLPLARDVARRGASFSGLVGLLLGSRGSRRDTRHLAALQGSNALLGTLDTLVVGTAGSAAVGAYQLVQRPMQGLAVLNGALGQLALNRSAHPAGARLSVRRLVSTGLVLTAAWLVLAALAGWFARSTAPPGVELAWSLFLGLGAAAGIASMAAIAGPHLILRGASGAVLVGSLLQVLVVAVVGWFAVTALGFGGMVLAVLAARAVAVVVQVRALRALNGEARE